MSISPDSFTEVSEVGSSGSDNSAGPMDSNADASGSQFVSIANSDQLSSNVVGLDVYNNDNKSIGQIKERNGKDHDGAQRQQQRTDGRHGKGQRDEIELEEAAFFLFLVDDVERVHDGLHTGIGAPQRDHKSEEESKSELGAAPRREAAYLLAQDVDRALRQNTRGERKLITDNGGTGEQAIERDERRDRREDREQTVEYDARSHRQQPVLADLLIGPPKNIFPTPPGYLPGRLGMATTARLMRPFVLHGPARAAPKAPVAERPTRVPWGCHTRPMSLAIIMPTRMAEHSRSHSGAGEALSRASARAGAAAAIADLADFEKHETETEEHVARLEKVFEEIDASPRGKTCDAIRGIIEEGQEVMKEFKGAPALDAGLLAAAQAVEPTRSPVMGR